ncbi:MAG TPA: 50S ribosomal protein L17, partial [Spirochaetota bacterium]|nr:50S ribosomal protein L17 [Spirochaetota bacterium]
AHRKAMFENMVTSLFDHERVITTKEKGKELKIVSEKLITRAKKNIAIPDSEPEKKLHNKKEVFRVIKNKDIVKKLFDDIAPRFKDRNGGYTRMYLLGKRNGDAAEMAVVELVEKKPKTAEPKKEEKAKAK